MRRKILQIRILYDIYAFVEEKLFDECFESGGCIHGYEIIQLLSQKRNSSLLYIYSHNTTLKDVVEAIRADLGVNTSEFEWMPLSYSFLYNNRRYYIYDSDANFCNVLHKYLAPQNENEIIACILLSCNAGDVGFEYPLRFYVNSHEAGSHFVPHIHVCDTGHQYAASICIENGEVIAGKLPAKLAKIAKKEILSKQEYYCDCWNTKTDGLRVDINRDLGIIQY